MTSGFEKLDERQRVLVAAWLPGAEVVRDLSWDLVGTTVLKVVHGGERYVVKAGDELDRQMARWWASLILVGLIYGLR
ncbi:hypothetical protein [Kineosporia sp. NBRC 101731]|uniref:hypothetical protein n=1 Tax=Kineosporia sp. NBRC 101731 TaxID=3032199 RepID=UPI00255651F2|nr:hypothetical protein [Kineosporia sp. NBRC 101731]